MDLTVFARMFKVAQKYRNHDKIEPGLFVNNLENIEEFKQFMTISNYDMFHLTEVVRALICCGKVTKKLKFPNLEDDEENWQWMKEELDTPRRLSTR